MAKSRFDALGVAPGALVTLRPRDFGLFPQLKPILQARPRSRSCPARPLRWLRREGHEAYSAACLAPSVITGSMRSSSAGSMWQAMRWPLPKVRIGGSSTSQILPTLRGQRV